jgi:TonB family protein
METFRLSRCLALLAVVSLVCPFQIVTHQAASPNAAQIAASESNPNSPDGLQQLLLELLGSARHADKAKLRAEIVAMEIPDYENWFVRVFGQEKGQKLGDVYEASLKVSELHFEMLWEELAKQQGVILVERLDPEKAYALPADALDAYKASWKKTDDSAGPAVQSIGIFYFVDGQFRVNGSFHDVHVLSTSTNGPVVPPKLINRVPPVYPPLARQTGIQGTVAVNAIVRKDGTVTVQNVGAGHPLLAQAAVDAVQQWRYEPSTIDGHPIDVETKFYVVFTLAIHQANRGSRWSSDSLNNVNVFAL